VIKVLLADDQHLVRGALAALLTLEGDIEVVAEVGRGDELVQAAREAGAEVALVDVEMPGLDGLAATAALHAALPSCRVLILTTFGRPGYLRRAMEAGALGFMVKDAPPEQLADASMELSGVRPAERDRRLEMVDRLAVGERRFSSISCIASRALQSRTKRRR